MTSRLDRLFQLLENGSTPLTRKAAALQLGEVQKLHPHELNNLLIKVRQYLHNSSWDTRIAASQAVEAIVNNVPLWFPVGVPDVKKETNAQIGEFVNVVGRMTFEKYDVHTVIKCGYNLLASEGNEFDCPDSASLDSADNKEKIALLRQSLNERLGLKIGEKCVFQLDFISDLVESDKNDVDCKSVKPLNENKLDEIFNKVSASRSLKRKQTSRTLKSNGSICDDINKKKVKLEANDDSCSLPESIDSVPDSKEHNEWPLEWFCDELMGDLFSPHWEIRHGAATGLREIVKLQGKCAGRLKNSPNSEMDNLNQQWLEDLSLRLLSVLTLDRFGDFVSDQVVAPVRETCAQTLGLVIKFLSVDGVNNVLKILLQLLECSEWEARHGGMLGLKYLLAIRQDMIEKLLPEVFEPVFCGLKDSVDDVSAVAAAALVPVKNELMNLLPEKVPVVIAFLWEALLDLDELSSSTGDLLMLLSSLLTFKGLEMKHNLLAYDDNQLVTLIPRLWPFLSHSLSSVRKSVLDSLMILCEKSSDAWLTTTLLSDALRLLFQRSLIENVTLILNQLHKLWLNLLLKANYEKLIKSTCLYVPGWIILMMHSHKMAIEPCNVPVWLELTSPHMNHHSDLSSSVQSDQYYIGGAESFGDTSDEREKCVIRARYQCAKLIGTLAYFLTEPNLHPVESSDQPSTQEALESFAQILLLHLNSKSAIQRMCSAWIIKEWAVIKVERDGEKVPIWVKNDSEQPASQNVPPLQLYKTLANRCLELLQEPIYYDELNVLFSRIQSQFRDFVNLLRTNQVSFNESIVAGKFGFTPLQIITTLLNDISENTLPTLRAHKKPSKILKQTITSVEDRVTSIRRLINESTAYSNSLSIGVNSAIASALVSWHFLPEKLNPIIRPLMDSIKAESNEQLQRSSSSSLVLLLRLCSERIYHDQSLPTPLPKIIKNLITYLCCDKNFTPDVILQVSDTKFKYQLGILSLENMQKIADKSICLRRSNSMNVSKNKNSEESTSGNSNSAVSNGSNGNGNSTDANTDVQNEILRRGAMSALSESCRYFEIHLPDRLSTLWEHICELSKSKTLPTFDEAGLERARYLVQCLQVFEVIGPHVHLTLHLELINTFPFLCLCLESHYISIRHMASRCFGMLASILPNQTMNVILTKTLDLFEAADCELKRQGAVETINCIIDRLSLNIVPYIVFLIVPMLGRMSDQNKSVRLLATHCFAQLVQLMPLDNDNIKQNGYSKLKTENVDDNCNENKFLKIEFSEELVKRKENERRFLEQLMNIKKLDDYKLPIPVDAELRTYQQEGLNWLAFLNKYRLHGIVADEMGLGKTLQAICILASDHHYIRQRYLNGDSCNHPLLSIVICPPTLTGHWMYEVGKFVSKEHLCPLLYTGPPFERFKLKKKIKKAIQDCGGKRNSYNLVIASYDLVRNDIDFFSSINWNYCILDEGHVIKNGKTKLSKAIKSLVANHRLILTGTPIQNNVLELWSLLDFLMPGFLGTERQFMARYSKPILASRDAKSSSKEQEAGILAMEGLHRQVLPFILRRMKEDVLKDLPPKIMQDYYCELSSLQAQLYEDFYKSRARQTLKQAIDGEVDDYSTVRDKSATKRPDGGRTHIFQSLQYLRKVCNHPKLVLSPSHPKYDSIIQKLNSEKTTLSDINHAAKLCALKQLLLDCGIGTQSIGGQTESVVNQHRVLVFCQLKSMLDIVENDLLKVHMPSVSYMRLDGDVPANSRYSVIHTFNNDPSIDILLLTTQVGGLGLNLTGADTVIFVEHDWNPMKDLQAMDRAHRIGQKKVVNVYRLITTGTLEEKIMGLQKFKLTIANTVISNENANLDSMATDQLLDLFELSSANKTGDNSSASTSTSSKNMSVKVMLDSLPELWDTQQYDNQYDMDNFLDSLSQC